MTNQYRKAPPPSLGPAFEGTRPEWVNGPTFGTGSPVLMFDLSRLTWADYAEMRWHPQVNASLSLMSFMLHQIDWKIESEDKRAAAIVEENLRLIWTQLVRGISQAYWAGFSAMVLEWENTQDGEHTFISKVKDLHPGEASVNWLEVESSYRPPPPYDINTIVPKVRVFDGINKSGLNYPIPPEHSFWYPVLREHGDYTGRKLLKSAFAPWYFSHLIHLYSNRYFERFGEPVPIGRGPLNETYETPTVGDVPGRQYTGKQILDGALSQLRSGVAVVLPSDRDASASGINEFEYSLEYLESQMRGADFERYLSRLDEEISLAIFTPLLLLRAGDRGSLNLGVQHTATWLWALNGLAADLKEYIDPYICERIKRINVSPNAPRCEWVPRKMGKDNTETLRSIVTALVSKGSVKPDIDEMGVALGMSLKEIKEVVQPVADPRDTRDREERTDRTADSPNTVGEDRPPGVVGG